MRSVVWLLFSSLFLAGLSAQIGSEGEAGASSEYEEMLQAAQRKLLRGEVLAAETTLEELFEFLIEDGVDEDNRYRIGVEVGLNEIALRRGHYEKARDGLRALPKTAREVREVVLLQARVLRRLGDYEVAIALLKKLVATSWVRCCTTMASARRPPSCGRKTPTACRVPKMRCSLPTSVARCSGWAVATTTKRPAACW